jgi:ComF family protein
MMKLPHILSRLLFPPKCILCRQLLQENETDLCRECRTHTPEFTNPKKKLPYLAGWTALWYYEGDVRGSILRFKFYNARSYADAYGRMLAMKLIQEDIPFDILTWAPISRQRKWRRGYDQVELIARAVGKELGIEPIPTLKKRRNNLPQSGLGDAAQRRANVLGVYQVLDQNQICGKRILLLDDVVTTGATASECARVLLTAGAKEVYIAAIAASTHDKK